MQLQLIKTRVGHLLEVGIIGAKYYTNAVLYFHDIGTSIHAIPWDEQWLISSGITVISVNRTGIGNSQISKEYSIEEHIADVKDILDELKITNVYVLGWSAGGIYAMAFADKYREICKSLVLVSSAPPFSKFFIELLPLKWSAIRLINKHLPFLSVLFFKYISKKVVADFDRTWKCSIKSAPEADQKVLRNPDIRKRIIRAILDSWNHNGKAIFFDTKAITEFRIELPQLVGIPVAIYHGSYDKTWKLKVARMLHQQIPGSELIELDGQGHFAILHNFKSIIESTIK